MKKILTGPTIKLVDKLSSRPDKKRVDEALSELYADINANNEKKGLLLPFESARDKFVILSDQHKGVRNGADIFALGERNYVSALKYYNENNFFYINLGDSEELWENNINPVRKHNKETFEAEKRFLLRNAFIKIFGNHDLYWDNSPLAQMTLEKIYGQKVTIYEGIILKCSVENTPLEIYMTHGHQGDLQSDGNWFSKWFVANVWERFQAYLRINPNTPANNNELKTAHNKMMYQWSAKRKSTLLITGHTHQPVFKSFTQIEKLYNELQKAKKDHNKTRIAEVQKQIVHRENKGDKIPDFTGYLDTYFNTGCCCFDDGDITGIELSDRCIRLIKWQYGKNKVSERLVLEESRLEDLKIG